MNMAELQTGVLYCGDNLEVLHKLPEDSIDLIYIDPPFFSSRAYEIIYGDKREKRSFEDRWKGGIQHYVEWMVPRLAQMRRVLKPTGSIYVHLDTHAVHYIKVQMDDIFGVSNFRNEIVWKRTSAHSSAKRYGPNFDTILFYSKSDDYTWNSLFQPQDATYVKTHYTQRDERGIYRTDNLTGAGISKGSSGQPWRGFDPASKGVHWKFSVVRLEELDKEGRIHWPKKKGGWPAYKRYWHEVSSGTPLQAIWTDIPPINSQARERLGYPTQKPEKLLARIISASSNPGDIVADFFAGCGTTLATAQQLQRRWIGCDVSPTALRVVKQRLEKLGATEVRLANFPYALGELKAMNPFEFQNYVVDFIQGVHNPRKSGDYGVDGWTWWNHFPIQVKQQDSVGRPVIQGFASAIRKEKKERGYVFALGFAKTAHEETARLRMEEGLDIELWEVQKMVDTEPPPEFA